LPQPPASELRFHEPTLGRSGRSDLYLICNVRKIFPANNENAIAQNGALALLSKYVRRRVRRFVFVAPTAKCGNQAPVGDSVVFRNQNYAQHNQQAQDSLVVLAHDFYGDYGHDYIEN
jgi:hypothetical protein